MSNGNAEPRLRVVALAQLCNPEWVSGPLVGWNHALALTRHADVHLVTHSMNREGIERSSWPKDRVTFIELGRYEQVRDFITKRVFKVDHTTQMYTAVSIPFHWKYEGLIWQTLKPRLQAGEFDIVHRITPVSPVLAGPIAERCRRVGVPFVLGPINGGLPWPKGYSNALRKEQELISHVRQMYRYAPHIQSTWKRAAALMIASRTTWAEIPSRYHQKSFYVPENGIPEAAISDKPRQLPGKPLRAVFVGRLVPLKCVDVALRGAARFVRDKAVVLDIVGDGSERAYLEQVAREEGISEQTKFHGWLQHADTMKILSQSHVLLFPSIREFGGAVVIEAMALGVVPVVVDYGGPGEIVEANSGFRLPLASSEATAREIEAVLAKLVASPDRWLELSNGSRNRIRQNLSWEAKARMSVSIYQHVLGHGPRPELPLPAALN
jgi:glycosyltransferase involved in cell wall biosynthesis